MNVLKGLQKFLIAIALVVLFATLATGASFAKDKKDDDDGNVNVALSDDTNPTSWAVIASTNAVKHKKVTFHVTNISLSATRPHELVIIKTDLSPDQLPRLANGAADESQLQVIARTDRLTPGATADLKLKLKKGNYVLICNIGGHYGLGMYTGFRVGKDDDDD
ncbi:MAG TPA: hypothetical protein P5121_25590 [Caldilineaceae bacterium]|nr:hypothetical protein [Caldilineaceae bacterium]